MTCSEPSPGPGAIQVHSLRWNLSWTLLGDLIYAACQWAMLIVLAKFGSPEMVGRFALGLAVTAPVIIFTSLQLRPILATDVVGEYHFSEYFGVRLISTAGALLFIAAFAVFAGYHRDTILVILAVGLGKGIDAVSDVFHGLLQRHERLDTIAKSRILKGLLSLAAFTLGLYWTGDVVWGAVGLAASWLLVLISYDARYGALILKRSAGAAHIWRRLDLQRAYKLVRLALPLGFATMLVSLNDAIPRYVIEQYFGSTALGIYAAIAYLPAVGAMVVNALGQSAFLRLATYHVESRERRFRPFLFQMTAVAAAIGVMGILTALLGGREILTVVYEAQYADRVDVLLWLMAVGAIGYMASIQGYGLTAARLLRIQPYLLAASSIVALVCSYAWIPTLGLKGAAWAYGASFLAQLIGFGLCNRYGGPFPSVLTPLPDAPPSPPKRAVSVR